MIYPARYDGAIPVAATNIDDVRAPFSATGSQVELSAPGVSVLSTTIGGYGTLSGTSMASPHVAGLASLILASGTLGDENGDTLVNNQDVRLLMQRTAVDLGTAGRDTRYGYGRIDASAAIAPTPRQHSPSGQRRRSLRGPSGPVGWIRWLRVYRYRWGPAWLHLVIRRRWNRHRHLPQSHVSVARNLLCVSYCYRRSGGVDTDTSIATITEANLPPTANAGPDQTVSLGTEVTLDGSLSFDSDGSIVSRQWNLGDGTVKSGAVVTHTYSTAGTYVATLTVTDNDESTDTDFALITVVGPTSDAVHIEDITMVLRSKLRGWQTWVEGRVLVVDEDGIPLSGVEVSAQWSGATSSADTIITGSDGIAKFRSRTVRRPTSGTLFLVTVLDLSKSGYAYDSSSNVVTVGSIVVP